MVTSKRIPIHGKRIEIEKQCLKYILIAKVRALSVLAGLNYGNGKGSTVVKLGDYDWLCW
jgi:hypothetical protein